jgi:hypothetical protein
MMIHRVKCRLGLHDWESTSHRYDDVVLVEKECLWCTAETATVHYPFEGGDRTGGPARTEY